MKRIFCLLLAMTLASSAGVMQAQQPQNPPQPPSQQPQGQQPPQPSQPQQQPAAPGQPGAAQDPAAMPQQPAAGRPQPQAKTQEEYQAFQAVAAKTAPAEQEQAAVEFAAKYPDSGLRPLLFLNAMRGYQNADNSEKTVEMARKVLEIDSSNPEALVTMANVLAERTRETDLDRDERLAEAVRSAEKALQTVDTELVIPPNVPPDRVAMVKDVLRSMAHSAMGTVEMSRKDWPAAEQHLRKSVELNSVQPDAVSWLRLAVVLDQQKKYQEALEAVNKAVQHAPEGSQAANLAKTERERLQKLTGAAPATPPSGSMGATPPTQPQTQPPGQPQTQPSGQPQTPQPGGAPAPKPQQPPPPGR